MDAVGPQSASARFWDDARQDPKRAGLVRDTYMDADVAGAAARFATSGEFDESWRLITAVLPTPSVAVDLGAGNGIATAALLGRGVGFVYAVEPDPDEVIGRGAIRRLVPNERCQIVDALGEGLPIEDGVADLVYARQVLHHATDLHAMVAECARVLRSGGLFLSLRDHVAETKADLEAFLASHPVHQVVGGENAHPLREYLDAVGRAGLRIDHVLGPFDSVINTYPEVSTAADLAALPRRILERRAGAAGRMAAVLPPVRAVVARRIRNRRWPGMPVSIVAVKP